MHTHTYMYIIYTHTRSTTEKSLHYSSSRRSELHELSLMMVHRCPTSQNILSEGHFCIFSKSPCRGHWTLSGFCGLAPGFPLASSLNTFAFQHHPSPPCPWFLKPTDAMVARVTQCSTLHRGAFALSTASSSQPDCKSENSRSNASRPWESCLTTLHFNLSVYGD